MPKLIITCASVLITFLLGACARSTQPPRFELISARTAERTSEGVSVELVILGENPNGHDIELREARYRVSAGNNRFFEGVRSPEVTLPRYGRVEMILPAAAPLERFPANAQSLTIEGRIEYLEPGPFAEVLYDARLRRPAAPVRGTTKLTP